MQVSIYNDKSTDNSATIIEEWTKKFPELNQWIVSVVVGLNDGTEGKGKNRSPWLEFIVAYRIVGCGFAKNKSIAQSHGKFLCFLDADDIMYPERLEELFHAGVDHPNDIIGSNFRRFVSPDYAQLIIGYLKMPRVDTQIGVHALQRSSYLLTGLLCSIIV